MAGDLLLFGTCIFPVGDSSSTPLQKPQDMSIAAADTRSRDQVTHTVLNRHLAIRRTAFWPVCMVFDTERKI